MASAAVLNYGGNPGDTAPATGTFTSELVVTAPAAVAQQLLAMSELMALQKIQIHTEGRRVIDEAVGPTLRMRVVPDTARIEGLYRNRPFQFEFTQSSPPPSASDPLKQIAWTLSMGRSFLLGPKGEYQTGSAGEEAHGEAMGLVIDGAVRLPDTPVPAGHTWTTEWTGTGRQKSNGGVFKYRQTAELQRLEDGDAPRAHIAFQTSGRLEFPGPAARDGEETVFDAKGTVVLDLKTGFPVANHSSGVLTSEFKAANVKLVRRIEAHFGTE